MNVKMALCVFSCGYTFNLYIIRNTYLPLLSVVMAHSEDIGLGYHVHLRHHITTYIARVLCILSLKMFCLFGATSTIYTLLV